MTTPIKSHILRMARQLAGAAVFSLLVSFQAMADGTETLGPPSIAIATGTGIVAAGTGMLNQPGFINLTVPGAVKQVILYWEGFNDRWPPNTYDLDDTISVNGIDVTGTRIGGPATFWGSVKSSVFRADITNLSNNMGWIGEGVNLPLIIDGMEFSEANNGAGVMVIYDDGNPPSEIQIRDGLDLAYIGFNEPQKSTIEQTFTFDPAPIDRSADLALFFSSVAGPASKGDTADRPELIRVTVDGITYNFPNTLASNDGDEWDTVNLPNTTDNVIVPAGASSMTIQAFSEDFLGTGNQPASFTWTAVGLSMPPFIPRAALGDRVWQDLDHDGNQDCLNPTGDKIGDGNDGCQEPGIPGVPVELFAGNCTDSLGRVVTTNFDGFYLFEELEPGNYCVKFGTPPSSLCVTDGFDLGEPVLTLKNATNDGVDSDANPSGFSDPVSLGVDERNLTVDAGFICPAKIGDRVWEDDGDGIQECTDTNLDGMIGGGDSGPDCDSGIEGVTVTLFDCGFNGQPGGGDDTEIGERTTDANGFYMFGAEGEPDPFTLPPGTYYVQFDQDNLPAGFEDFIPTALKQGGNDILDSDCRSPDGITACTTVGPRGINLNRDCGLKLDPECDLLLDKQCRVEPEPPVSFDKCDGKLKQFTVVWNGGDGNVLGNVNMGTYTTPSNTSTVNNGDEVVFTGPYGSNDVEVEFSGGTYGQSTFHMSCSDDDFNDPTDCGKDAGDGKGDSGFDNDWTLEGFIDDENRVLDCNPTSNGPFADNCTFPASQLPNCETAGKPSSLTLRYTGGGCGASDNDQDKSTCQGRRLLSGDVSVTAAGNKLYEKDIYDADPDFVVPGATFDLTFKGGSDFKSNTYVRLMTTDGLVQENNKIHTSCSDPLAVGDVFGSLTVVAINGQSGSRDVTYKYTVTNNGPLLSDLHNIKVTDIPLGDIGAIGFLGAGDSVMFDKTVPIVKSTTNTGTATGFLPNNEVCSASDSVRVTVTPPPIPPAECDELKPIDALILEYDATQTGGLAIDSVRWYKDKVDTNDLDKNLIDTTGPVSNGDVVTFDGFAAAGASNDVDFYIEFSDGSIATSRFHRSCSDDDMDDVTDCGTLQGDGKNDDAGLNTWILRDLAGEGKVLGCP